ncbi:histidine kinase [Flavobacterium sp. SUN052]|uniref:sensor histidine kinase n=1 Tax=Flavobacterium sp. SUN052 TaxID=3002441 RepID=UPI00237E4C48|nr:histidine kinase [Flavobacterium sp. SUN052]MEC4004877.1 histidine kinase [Flavobacterium sp. SUN052]
MKRNEAEQLLKVSLESEKNERRRIAADLHDSVSSDLSAIRNYLAIILKDEKDEKRASLFQELKEGVEVAMENTRQVSYKLMPPLLDSLGFEVALEDYLNKLNTKTELLFTISSKDERFDLDSSVSYELFRIIQEFTTNMLKYGSIKNCHIALYVISSVGYIEIIDDGEQYDFMKSLSQSKGTGLKNISSRLKIIDAKLLQRAVMIGNHFVISFSI